MRIRFLAILFGILCFSHLAIASDDFASRPDVKTFINQMVKKHQFKQSELVTLFNAVKVRPAVMQSINAPLEQKPWYTYQMLFVSEWRVRQGVEFWNTYHDALARAEKTYGVPASIIVATIGLETKYGKHTGTYRVIDALANIAFSGSKRAPYFKSELEQFLLLAREEHLDPLKVMGSYAGAIGQPQFMPSSYRNYAVNFSGNPKIDLSNNEIDVIGSIANYYNKHGWAYNQPVALPVSLKDNKFQALLQEPNYPHFSQLDLAKYGIVPNQKFMPNQKIKLIELQGYYGKEYWLGFPNFYVIKRYNSSDLYAMAIFQLSYYISTLREKLDNA